MSNLKNTYFNLDSFILNNLLESQTQETFFDEFKSWWMEKRNNNEDPINIEFDVKGIDFKRSLRNAIDVEVPGHIFIILSELWEMWAKNSDVGLVNQDNIRPLNPEIFGKDLMNVMKKNDFVFDQEAMGAKTAVDRQDKDTFQKEYPDVGLNEQEMEYTRDNTFTYNENFLKDKLGNPVKDVYEFNNDNGHMTIYP